MASIILLSFGFLMFNIFWLSSLFSYPSLENEAIPKFIHSSAVSSNNKTITYEYESHILKALAEFISNANSENQEADINFKTTKNENDKIDNNLLSNKQFIYNSTSVLHIPSNSTKVSMYINQTSKDILYLTVTNTKRPKFKSNFEYLYGEVSLSISSVSDYFIQKNTNVFNKCWTTNLPGRIIGAVSSNDKSTLVIYYSLINGPKVSFRIRVYHNITCGSRFKDSENEFHENINFFTKHSPLQRSKPISFSLDENYTEFYINETTTSKDEVSNYFNDDTFDDFLIPGNAPITTIAIQKDILVYSRSIDYHEYYMLKRQINQWKILSKGQSVNRNNKYLHYSNSLKFLYSKDTDILNILNVYLEATSDSMEDVSFSTSIITYSLSDKAKSITVYSKINLSKFFNENNNTEIIKKFMKPCLFSSFSSTQKSFTFQITQANLMTLDWNEHKNGGEYEAFDIGISPKLPDLNLIANNKDNTIVVLMSKTDNKLLLIQREFTYGENGEKTVHEYNQKVNFKYMPKFLRTKQIINLLIDEVGDKCILFILTNEGDLVLMDLTESIKSKGYKQWRILSFIYELDFNVIVILIGYFMIIPFILKVTLNSNNDNGQDQRRFEEFQRVAQQFEELTRGNAQGNNINRESNPSQTN